MDGNAGPPEPAQAASPTTGAPDTPAPHAPAQPEPELPAGETEPALPAGEPEAPVGPTADASSTTTEEPPAEDQPPTLGDDLDKLAAMAQKADEYLELAQRTKADFDNYRKRASREAAVAQERGVAKLAKELLPAVDNLDRALTSAQEHRNGDELVSGIELVHADVIAALARVGIEPFSPEGERFDPTYHEAIAQQPIEGAEPGTVVEVYQRGYRLGEVVLRPARVVVAG